MENALPAIPPKRYFTIGEVSELCGVKPYVLRYWEQEFTQLRPMKRRGNRRYYQHHEVLLIRRIRDLLYEQGFTISGARNRLTELGSAGLHSDEAWATSTEADDDGSDEDPDLELRSPVVAAALTVPMPAAALSQRAPEAVLSLPTTPRSLREELISIRALLAPED